MADITLSSAVRSNLNALQATSDLMSSVQEKLSTGKKVNSALDNPNSFFTAKGLENRASDLSSLLDDMGQSVQTLQAADKGITAISDLVDAAKAKANQAAQTSSQSERAQYASEYNELLTQIEDIAKDSGYKGKNLLGGTGNDLSVTFNEDGSSSLSISAVDYTDASSSTGLNLSDLTEAT
ncbi:MAG: flagellin, partial [Roseibium sp.]